MEEQCPSESLQKPCQKVSPEVAFRKALDVKLEAGNKGFELMLKMGYQSGQGLGKSGEGMTEPLDFEFKVDRKGLGLLKKGEQANPGPAAGAQMSKKQRRRLRNQAKAETKGAAKADQETAAEATALGKAMKQAEVEAASKTVAMAKWEEETAFKTVAKARNGEASNAKKTAMAATPPKPKAKASEIEKVVGKVTSGRKHSPIYTPTPSSVRLSVKQNKTKASPTAAKAVPKSSTKLKRPQFSIKDICTRNYLHRLAQHFKDDIEILRLRLEAEASRQPLYPEDDLIVCQITLGSGRPIAEHAFEFIRTDLVGWIGVYQEKKLDTPIFHSMSNNETHITVVCDNAYAYECLEQCINEISQLHTLGAISVSRSPSITPDVHCYNAVYVGIARDVKLFLTQVKLHKSKLNTDHWIVASHEVFTRHRETHFMFLIDERSALALNFHYRNHLFICMQVVMFQYRGTLK